MIRYLQQFLLQAVNHIDRHLVEVILGIPAPLVASAAVVHLVGPAVGDSLTDRIELVLHFKVGIVLLDGVVDDFRVETHAGNIERVTVNEFCRRLPDGTGQSCLHH